MVEEFQNPPQSEEELFQFYERVVKPLYTEIEARQNCLPIELLFEVFAAFDHLKRFYTDELPISEAVGPAFSHLKRGALDAFKLKLKYYNTDYEFFEQNAHLFALIDNGDFTRALQQNRKSIIRLGKQARLEESKKNISQAFQTWIETSLLIDVFYDQFYGSQKVIWAKTHYIKGLWKERLIAAGLGIIIGLLTAYIVHLIGW